MCIDKLIYKLLYSVELAIANIEVCMAVLTIMQRFVVSINMIYCIISTTKIKAPESILLQL